MPRLSLQLGTDLCQPAVFLAHAEVFPQQTPHKSGLRSLALSLFGGQFFVLFSGLCSGPNAPVVVRSFQGSEESLSRRVVPTHARQSHRSGYTVVYGILPDLVRGVLGATIRVEHNPFGQVFSQSASHSRDTEILRRRQYQRLWRLDSVIGATSPASFTASSLNSGENALRCLPIKNILINKMSTHQGQRQYTGFAAQAATPNSMLTWSAT